MRRRKSEESKWGEKVKKHRIRELSEKIRKKIMRIRGECKIEKFERKWKDKL